jgi:hypothetical protein
MRRRLAGGERVIFPRSRRTPRRRTCPPSGAVAGSRGRFRPQAPSGELFTGDVTGSRSATPGWTSGGEFDDAWSDRRPVQFGQRQERGQIRLRLVACPGSQRGCVRRDWPRPAGSPRTGRFSCPLPAARCLGRVDQRVQEHGCAARPSALPTLQTFVGASRDRFPTHAYDSVTACSHSRLPRVCRTAWRPTGRDRPPVADGSGAARSR